MANDKNSGGSSLDLRLTFDATGDTPRRPASQIAGLIRQFIAIEMDLANVRVEVTESHLNYVEPYEAEVEAAKAKAFEAPDVISGASLAWGNPAKDGSN